jgi:hypothetical protein
MPRVLLAIVLAMAAPALPAAAQSQSPSPPAPAAQPVQFMSRTLFRLGGEHLSGQNPQFVWEGNFFGDIDFVDWGRGRGTFVANYQVLLGEEFKSFDPNQGNYTLGLSGSARLGQAEITGIFHHESRHLSDRLKRTAVDWNMVGVGVQGTGALGVMFIDARARYLGVIQKAYVDYRWEFDGRLRNDIVLRPGIGVLFSGDLHVFGVDDSRARGTQYGGRAEGGVRFDGQMGALELFAAVERRVDPAPLEFGTIDWVTMGFRLSSR